MERKLSGDFVKIDDIIKKLKNKKVFSWEKEGRLILNSNKTSLTNEERRKLKYLLLLDMPEDLKSRVLFLYNSICLLFLEQLRKNN